MCVCVFVCVCVYRGGSHKITVGANDFPLHTQPSRPLYPTLSLIVSVSLVRPVLSSAPFLYLRRFLLKLLYSFSLSVPPSEYNNCTTTHIYIHTIYTHIRTHYIHTYDHPVAIRKQRCVYTQSKLSPAEAILVSFWRRPDCSARLCYIYIIYYIYAHTRLIAPQRPRTYFVPVFFRFYHPPTTTPEPNHHRRLCVPISQKQ